MAGMCPYPIVVSPILVGRIVPMPAVPRKPRVYVVDHDADHCANTVAGLIELGLEVEGFPDAPAFYRALVRTPCHIAVIDVALPGEDGYTMARHLRGASGIDMGIVLVTARDEVEERIRGLRDADLHLTKPVDPRELAAALFSLDRRLSASTQGNGQGASLRDAVWSLIDSGWTLYSSLGHRVPLTHSERTFMLTLADAPGQIVSRETLAQVLSGEEAAADYDLHRLDALVSRLRRKFAEKGADLPVRAVRGVGYLFMSA
jgi:two-component system, OmpR family, response regulator PhoP